MTPPEDDYDPMGHGRFYDSFCVSERWIVYLVDDPEDSQVFADEASAAEYAVLAELDALAEWIATEVLR